MLMFYCVFAADYYQFVTCPVGVSLSVLLMFVSAALCLSLVSSCYDWLLSFNKLLDFLAASCRVYLLSRFYCILLFAALLHDGK